MNQKIDDLTFAELRLASHLHKPSVGEAMAALIALTEQLGPQTVDSFLAGEEIESHVRLLRQKGGLPLLTQVLADMVIQIDRFAAVNNIDLAAAIRARFDPAGTGGPKGKGDPHDLERK